MTTEAPNLLTRAEQLEDLAERIMRHCNEASECPFCGIDDGEHEPNRLCSELDAALGAPPEPPPDLSPENIERTIELLFSKGVTRVTVDDARKAIVEAHALLLCLNRSKRGTREDVARAALGEWLSARPLRGWDMWKGAASVTVDLTGIDIDPVSGTGPTLADAIIAALERVRA